MLYPLVASQLSSFLWIELIAVIIGLVDIGAFTYLSGWALWVAGTIDGTSTTGRCFSASFAVACPD